MAVTGLQKMTMAAVLVLCAALILPRLLLRREPSEETAQGRFPPMMHRHVTPDMRGQRAAGVRGQGEVRGTGSGAAGTGGGGSGTGSGPGGKSNLAAQIIPVYGFGILLYILYILFKITSKGHSKPSQSRLHSLRSENNKRKITDFELSQLQERLRETELVMENLVNTSLQEEDSAVSVSVDQEQNLLQQLTEITRAMKSNHLDFPTSSSSISTFTSMTEETDSLDIDPFWSHCSCNCPQNHEEETTLEDQPTHGEETALVDQQTVPEDQETMEEQPQTEQELQCPLEENQETAAEQQKEPEAPEVHLEKQDEAMEENRGAEHELQLQNEVKLLQPLNAGDTNLTGDCPHEMLEHQTAPDEDTLEKHINTLHQEETVPLQRAQKEQSECLQSSELFPQSAEEMFTHSAEETFPQSTDEMFPPGAEEMFPQNSNEMFPQSTEEMFLQSAEEKVHPKKREVPAGMRRRNRRRRGRRL